MSARKNAVVGGLVGALTAFMFTATQPALADIIFVANITHTQEVANPPVPDQGTGGTGLFVLNNAQTQLAYTITLFGLDLDGLQTPANPNDNVTRAHIHSAPPGANGGVVFGQIDPNNDLDDRVIDAVNGIISGIWDLTEGNGTTLAAQLPNLFAGNLYFNVHTPDHTAGEVRGQIVLLPEPSALSLFALGLLGVLAARRRFS